MDDKSFDKIVAEAVKEIPKVFLDKLENVAIIVQDKPTYSQLIKLKIRNNSLLLGLYQGVPQIRRWGGGQVLPDKITIFKRPIEILARMDEEKIKEIVKDTVKHEIAHHFGMDEEEIRKAQRKN